jgi:zinc transport system permease protein
VLVVDLVLLGLIALTVVTVIRVVGIVLMIALLTMPAAVAQLYRKTVKGMMLTASLLTLFAAVLGLFISTLINFAPGPIIVLILASAYILAVLFNHWSPGSRGPRTRAQS